MTAFAAVSVFAAARTDDPEAIAAVVAATDGLCTALLLDDPRRRRLRPPHSASGIGTVSVDSGRYHASSHAWEPRRAAAPGTVSKPPITVRRPAEQTG
ncbi:hypothetical protein FEK35_16175 [Nocardia cyriacigeorgica]|uniref:Uncharacterized protein n=1 Tax=Nocardia cyriacigeorgica TaxID=135487 RepID=A0A5R8PDC4_9NOCA|nr:hypothetical protein [Nocardia cyriacigeorgica]TLG09047.1 hypothetical protein FEK35_16175 [Nocardia cyriacigeorgica]